MKREVIPTCDILGVRISMLSMQDTVQYIGEHLEELSGHYICVSNVHTTVMSYDDESYKGIQNGAVMALADGCVDLYSGNDDQIVPLLSLGGKGVISVTANLLPREMHEMACAAVAGNVAVARAINDRLMPLHQKLFCEPNPVAPKWALYRMGRIGSGIRLPLTMLSEANRPVVEKAMREAGVEF